MFAVALWLGYLLLCLFDLGLLIVLSITVLCYLVLVARGTLRLCAYLGCLFGQYRVVCFCCYAVCGCLGYA